MALALAACSPSPSATPSQPSATRGATATPIDVSCTRDTPAPAYLGDPCPSAIVVVEVAVAPVLMPIARMVIEPGPFFCSVVWAGSGTAPPCYEPAIQPGQFMHAWVSFTGSGSVAAVMLGRDLPTGIGSPPPTPPPWTATLVTVEVPPAGWTMP